MALSRLIHRLTRDARALITAACILLALTATAAARTADTPQPVVHNSPAPTVVKETVLAPDNNGPSTTTLVLIGIGATAALLGAGYLGARIALRKPGVARPTASSAKSATPTRSGHASRTGV